MVTLQDVSKLLTMENKIILQQTDGLSQTDTLIQPQPGGNCMNWVLGHLLESQIVLLEALGGVSPVDREALVHYKRESDPILGEGEGVLSLENLLGSHRQVHSAIKSRLKEMNEEEMDEEIIVGEKSMNRGWYVFFLHFHYTYHIGQLELLRQLAGKLDKII